MQTYRNGREFQKVVLGEALYRDLLNVFEGSGFSRDVKRALRAVGQKYPLTPIGEDLHRQVSKQLRLQGIDPAELALISSVDTRLDLYHGVDGFFFLPSLSLDLVTVDAYLVATELIFSQREKWIGDFGGTVYSATDFQTDLFRYKTGRSEWVELQKQKKREERERGEKSQPKTEDLFSKPAEIDFREFAPRGREENHFVLTPYHVRTRTQREEFAKLVAGYFAKAAQETDCHNTALLSS